MPAKTKGEHGSCRCMRGPASPLGRSTIFTTPGLLRGCPESLRGFPRCSLIGKRRRLLGFVRPEPPQHEVEHTHLHGGLTGGRQPLIVLAVPPISPEPSQCPLHHPAPM